MLNMMKLSCSGCFLLLMLSKLSENGTAAAVAQVHSRVGTQRHTAAWVLKAFWNHGEKGYLCWSFLLFFCETENKDNSFVFILWNFSKYSIWQFTSLQCLSLSLLSCCCCCFLCWLASLSSSIHNHNNNNKRHAPNGRKTKTFFLAKQKRWHYPHHEGEANTALGI